MRDIFMDVLYDETVDGKEFELIPVREFSELVKSIMGLED